MAINIVDNLKVFAPKPIDDRYLKNGITPYLSVSEVNQLLNTSVRYPGLTVLILNQEYWYKNGIQDNNLILKVEENNNNENTNYYSTTGESTTILHFDNIFGKFLEDRIQDGNENYTLYETGNILGGTIYQRFESDGISTINFSNDFDFIYGISSGDVLPAGIYEFYFLYKNNGKVTVNIPNSNGINNIPDEVIPTEEDVVWTNLINTSVDGTDLVKSGGISGQWDASAHSTRQILQGENIILEWEIVGLTTDYQIAVGLNASNESSSFNDIDFSIATTFAIKTLASVFENGINKSSNVVENYVVGDKFGVKVENGGISYLYNGNVIYTSLVSPSYPLFVDCSVRGGLARVRNAKIIEI